MNFAKITTTKSLSAALAAASLLSSASAYACACGCGVFDVGAASIMPADSASGASVWLRFNTLDQNKNWEGTAQAPAADNGDKRIKTDFYTIGGQYMVNRNWMVMAELPIYKRALTTTDDGTVFGAAGSVYTGHITALGDLQLTAMYTGLAADMSTGIGIGVKLSTGDSTGPNGPLGGAQFDRDSLPGTGSTDLVASAYHVGHLDREGRLSWFAQARYDVAFSTRRDYRPGNELDGSLGVSYDLGAAGPVSKIAPVLSLLGSLRARDSGANADPANTGYERLLIAPGINIRLNKVRLYADIELPIYQHTNSDVTPGASGQLVAAKQFNATLSYDF
jgi:hypothetical protein